MKKQTIVDKMVHGGMLVEKYFIILKDGTDIQLPYSEWILHQIGSDYPKHSQKDSSINWKEMHDMQQKLVIEYTLENEKLKENIKTLELKLRVEELTNHLISKKIKEDTLPNQSVNAHPLKQICHQCGNEFITNEIGVTNHINNNDTHLLSVDYDLDQDHTPYEL